MNQNENALDVGNKDGLAGGPKWEAYSDGTFRGWGVAIAHPSGDGTHYAPFATGLSEKDARAISAARDLLTALGLLRNKQGCFCKPTSTRVRGVKKTVHFWECLVAQSAIAKATGSEPANNPLDRP